MSAIGKRLRRGWVADLALRSLGLALLLACAILSLAVCRLVQQPPAHETTPLEFAIAAPLWGSLSAGLALSLEGAGLFQRLPMPPRALLPASRKSR